MSEASAPSQALSKSYESGPTEKRWYAAWREAGCFDPPSDDAGRPHFSVVLPPPNVTGRLHMGHALTATIEDLMVRWHRMRGFSTVWLPGTDHAGIATQVMVERQLAARGESRQGVGRERFVEEVWKWKEEQGGIIDRQHETLGASLSWDRYRFTMDDVSSRAVREAFCRLHEEGLVYRAYRLINWDHGSQTALSDLEVDAREVDGKLWRLSYPVTGSEKRLIVATTRPETMLGDTAVAVHPDDPRYKALIGKTVTLPITGRQIPIVADSILVDMEFGTGAVKVTPAHDFNDFETGKRHDLELIQILGLDGKICAPAPEQFLGMDVKTARKAVLAALQREGALVGEEPHKMAIGHSQRTGVVVEPLPSFQWFVKVAPLAEPALAAVRTGQTQIIPEHRTQDYYRWMENIHDWCISRQLWWGHRIPAWHCASCPEITVAREDPSACAHCGGTDLRQDEDVLDTWFSSGLWPLTTLGWPAEENELDRFYPTSLMETGWDILFFWVARMMMFGIHFGGDVPFRKVFLHSMVLGEDGRKMGKMKGNVVDPVGLIEQFGADSLRFYLCTMAGQDNGIVFSQARVEGYRNFMTKLWNASRFAQMHLDPETLELAAWRAKVVDADDLSDLGIADRWIIARSAEVSAEVNTHLAQWRMDLAAHAAYQFVWHELCDWYLELAKHGLRSDRLDLVAGTRGTLATVFDVVLRLLHPMIPFVTEEIWSRLPKHAGAGEFLMTASYPGESADPATPGPGGPLPNGATLARRPECLEASADIERLIAIVTTARMLKAESKVPPASKVRLIVRSGDPEVCAGLRRLHDLAMHAGRFAAFEVMGADGELPREAAISVLDDGVEVGLPLSGLVDLDEERRRLAKEIAKGDKELVGLDKKLGNEKFLAKAPADVVERERARALEISAALDKKRALLDRLQG